MDTFDTLPEKIKKHLDELTKSSNLSYNEESKNIITKIWIEKKNMFEEQIRALDMIELESLDKDDAKGSLLLTYSGSLISLSPMTKKYRSIEYYSIKLRQDVPEIALMEEANILGNISVDNFVQFSKGPIKKTSGLFKIASFKESVSLDEQVRRIRQATIFLTNAFVKINRTILLDEDIPEQFNMKSIVKFIAEKNGITQKQARQILEDYLYMIECGMLLGEKVSLGRLGNMTLRKKDARKARIGINPKTMEKITIDAKPEMMAPRMGFSKSIRQKAATIKLKVAG